MSSKEWGSPSKMPTRTIKIQDLTQILGTSKASQVLRQIEESKHATYRALSKETLTAAGRYNQWLSSRGRLPANYKAERRRLDRASWIRVAERLALQNKRVQQLIEAYLKRAEREPEDVRVPCPVCGSPELLHGLDIHLSRTHGVHGPHYPGSKR